MRFGFSFPLGHGIRMWVSPGRGGGGGWILVLAVIIVLIVMNYK